MLNIVRDRARQVVEAAGARFDAVWEPPSRRLVLFTSKRTGSTLALDLHLVLSDRGVELVRAELAESDARFGLKV